MPATGTSPLTTTHGMVDRVHGHAPDVRAATKPAASSGFSEFLALVLTVTDLADARSAKIIELSDLSRRQSYQHVIAFFGHELCPHPGTTHQLGPLADFQLDVVDDRTKRNIDQGKTISRLDVNIVPGNNGGAHGNSLRRQNVPLFSIGIAQQGDIGGSVGIVFDRHHRGLNASLVTLEVDQPIFAFMSATDVSCGQPTVIVPATGLYQAADKAFFRSIF